MLKNLLRAAIASSHYLPPTVTFNYRGTDVTYGVVYNSTTGRYWLDRNLGASQVATAFDDSAAYGDLFQWGRLDDGHQDRGSGETSTLSSTDDPGHSNFILAPDSPYDWRDPQNNALWNSPDYDNCISEALAQGFRLPTETELETERLSWSSNGSIGAFASPLKLTVAGNRENSDGSLDYVGSFGKYFCSTISTKFVRYLHFGTSADSAYIGNVGRANGLSVRLIYDASLDNE